MPAEGIAIELKYVTRKLELEEEGELFALRNHSAQGHEALRLSVGH